MELTIEVREYNTIRDEDVSLANSMRNCHSCTFRDARIIEMWRVSTQLTPDRCIRISLNMSSFHIIVCYHHDVFEFRIRMLIW